MEILHEQKNVPKPSKSQLIRDRLQEIKEGNESKLFKRERNGGTGNLPAIYRRMDSFARLLAAKSICAAVSIFNGELLLATNELYEKEKIRDVKNQHFQSVQEIAQHFQKLVQNKESDKENVFIQICSPRRLTLKNSSYKISEPSAKKIAINILGGSSNQLIGDSVPEKDRAAYVLADGLYRQVFRHFQKLESSVIPESKSHRLPLAPSTPSKEIGISDQKLIQSKGKLTEEQLAALTQGARILEVEVQNVHAEMRLLSHIVDQINRGIFRKKPGQEVTTIYIGLSKLCCLGCHKMLEAANKVFDQNRILLILEFRGHHDIDFPNWECPKLFLDGFYDGVFNKFSMNHSLEYKIGLEGGKAITEALANSKGPSKVSMSPDKSDSEIEDSGRDQKLEALKRLYKQQSQKFSSPHPSSQDKDSVDEIAKIALAIKLYELRSFNNLWKLAPGLTDGAQPERRCELILAEYNTKAAETFSPVILKKDLLEVLQNPQFVGSFISQYFKTPSQSSSKQSLLLSLNKADDDSPSKLLSDASPHASFFKRQSLLQHSAPPSAPPKRRKKELGNSRS